MSVQSSVTGHQPRLLQRTCLRILVTPAFQIFACTHKAPCAIHMEMINISRKVKYTILIFTLHIHLQSAYLSFVAVELYIYSVSVWWIQNTNLIARTEKNNLVTSVFSPFHEKSEMILSTNPNYILCFS